MKKLPITLLAALAMATATHAQTTVSSDPVGFNSVTCLPNSDTICSVPFNSEVAFQGTLASAPSLNSGTATLTPSASVAWTTDQYKTLYYVRFISGVKSGMYYQVTTNAAGSLTVDLAGDDGSTIAAADQFKLCKFWTLGTLLPAATQTTAVPSSGNLGTQRRTEILFPDNITAGTNLAPTDKFFVVNTLEWRKAVSGFPNADNAILPPDTYFIVRHNNINITNATTFTSVGGVETKDLATGLSTIVTGQQDNFVSNGRPIPVRLADLDFSSTAFVDSAGNLGTQRRDQLLTYDNTTAVVNRSPSAIYFRVSGQWRKSVSGFPSADNDLLPAGVGFVIRKYQTADGFTKVWANNPY